MRQDIRLCREPLADAVIVDGGASFGKVTCYGPGGR